MDLKEISEKTKNLTIFEGFSNEERCKTFKLLRYIEKTYDEGATILEEGGIDSRIGIVLSGCVHAAKIYLDGSRDIINTLNAINLFGDALFFRNNQSNEIGVYAGENCRVVLMDFSCIDSLAYEDSILTNKLLSNLLKELSTKVLLLMEDKRILTQRSTRQKLISFLKREAIHAGNNSFRIKYNRQELADYLGVDRSAMISEMTRMKECGMIETHGKEFILLSEE